MADQRRASIVHPRGGMPRCLTPGSDDA